MQAKSAWDASVLLSESQRDAITQLGLVLAERMHAADAATASISKPAETDLQSFQNLLKEMEDQVRNDQVRQYRLYVDQLKNARQLCDDFLTDGKAATDHLKSLKKQREKVVCTTQSLHGECDALMKEQIELEQQVKEIEDTLQKFDEYDVVSRQYSSTTFSVGATNFLPLLVKIDDAISFFETHHYYCDSDDYLAKFKQLQKRGLTMIKNHVVATLKTTTTKLLISCKENQISNLTDTSVSYAQFRATAHPLKALMSEIDKRLQTSPEFEVLMDECRVCYCAQRLTLVGDAVRQKLTQLTQASDIEQILRSCGSVLVDLCHQEHNLFVHFFPTVHPGHIQELLHPFGTMLYDRVRPMIVKLENLDLLCNVADILHRELLNDIVAKKGDSVAGLKPFFCHLLEDVQERVIYRAQAYISDEIANFTPSKNALAFPEILSEVSSEASDDDSGRTAWYPTLPRTLLFLARMNTTVEKSIFESLAQEAISTCTSSLLYAGRLIGRNKGETDGLLFAIRHLLILREQIVPFDISFTVVEASLDFSNMKTAFTNLLKSSSQVLFTTWSSHNAISELMKHGAPQVLTQSRDTKKDLENELRKACEGFILLVTRAVAEPLLSFLTKTAALLTAQKARGENEENLRRHAFAQPDKIKEIMENMNTTLFESAPKYAAELRLYLPNAVTRSILVKPIKTNIVEAYGRVHGHISLVLTADEYQQMQIAKPHEMASKLDEIFS